MSIFDQAQELGKNVVIAYLNLDESESTEGDHLAALYEAMGKLTKFAVDIDISSWEDPAVYALRDAEYDHINEAWSTNVPKFKEAIDKREYDPTISGVLWVRYLGIRKVMRVLKSEKIPFWEQFMDKYGKFITG